MGDGRGPARADESTVLELASAVTIAVPVADDIVLDLPKAKELPPSDAVATESVSERALIESTASESEEVDATQMRGDAPIIAGVLTRPSPDAPRSQAALLVTVAILAWRAGCSYFLPGGRRPRAGSPGQVTSKPTFSPTIMPE